MSTVYLYLVALYASRVIALYIKQCRVIVTKMTGNAYFANPPVSLASVTAALNMLETLEEATLKGPKGSATARDAQLLVVRALMRQIKAFVQSVSDADVANGQAIIESAGFSVGKRTARTKQDVAVKYGSLPATLRLVAKALKGKVCYMWQMSTDQRTWTALPTTVKASTVVTGLTPGTLYYFQVRTLTVAGLSEWSVTVSIIAR